MDPSAGEPVQLGGVYDSIKGCLSYGSYELGHYFSNVFFPLPKTGNLFNLFLALVLGIIITELIRKYLASEVMMQYVWVPVFERVQKHSVVSFPIFQGTQNDTRIESDTTTQKDPEEEESKKEKKNKFTDAFAFDYSCRLVAVFGSLLLFITEIVFMHHDSLFYPWHFPPPSSTTDHPNSFRGFLGLAAGYYLMMIMYRLYASWIENGKKYSSYLDNLIIGKDSRGEKSRNRSITEQNSKEMERHEVYYTHCDLEKGEGNSDLDHQKKSLNSTTAVNVLIKSTTITGSPDSTTTTGSPDSTTTTGYPDSTTTTGYPDSNTTNSNTTTRSPDSTTTIIASPDSTIIASSPDVKSTAVDTTTSCNWTIQLGRWKTTNLWRNNNNKKNSYGSTTTTVLFDNLFDNSVTRDHNNFNLTDESEVHTTSTEIYFFMLLILLNSFPHYIVPVSWLFLLEVFPFIAGIVRIIQLIKEKRCSTTTHSTTTNTSTTTDTPTVTNTPTANTRIWKDHAVSEVDRILDFLALIRIPFTIYVIGSIMRIVYSEKILCLSTEWYTYHEPFEQFLMLFLLCCLLGFTIGNIWGHVYPRLPRFLFLPSSLSYYYDECCEESCYRSSARNRKSAKTSLLQKCGEVIKSYEVQMKGTKESSDEGAEQKKAMMKGSGKSGKNLLACEKEGCEESYRVNNSTNYGLYNSTTNNTSSDPFFLIHHSDDGYSMGPSIGEEEMAGIGKTGIGKTDIGKINGKTGIGKTGIGKTGIGKRGGRDDTKNLVYGHYNPTGYNPTGDKPYIEGYKLNSNIGIGKGYNPNIERYKLNTNMGSQRSGYGMQSDAIGIEYNTAYEDEEIDLMYNMEDEGISPEDEGYTSDI